ncbi:hypothetical protein LTR84_011502 [Exophiala bonariae]|uniref:Uncharacterized protein n=1 Tax=Exophiala bonariae TaxID=1690606 RepID=A0AAV9NG71_9EURO|nr:hypothetical protein LTR84_011502 [Exophiala bonariae]
MPANVVSAPRSKTPVSNRRFLPTSASSISKASGPPSAPKNPFQSSRSTQGLPLAPPSSSTPRFQRPSGTPHVKDDIDVSFEEDPYSSALPRSRSMTKAQVFGGLEDETPQDQSPLLYRTTHAGRQRPEESMRKALESRLYPFTPVAKKQKVFHVQNQKQEPITISSSPEYDQDEDHEEDHIPRLISDFPDPQHLSDDDLEEEIEAIESPNKKDVTIASRFMEIPLVPNTTATVAKSAFRSISKSEDIPQIDVGQTLPDVFSPSKRNGKHDYIANGNAALVRRWVLDIAAQQSHSTQQKCEIEVAEAHLDNSRRFIVALDTDGSEWIIPAKYSQSRTSLQSGLNSIRPGSKLVLKSEATRWRVPIGPSSSEREIAVAAYWDVVT